MSPRARVLLALLALQLAGCASIGKSLYEGDRDQRRAEIGLVERRVVVDDHEVELFERPGPGPVLLLVHGFGGDKDSWNRQIPFFPEDARLISPSLPAFGASTFKADARYDFASQADRLALLLDALEIERVHVVGVSMGGAVATTFAARHPDRTTTLTAICPAGINPPEPTPFQVAWREGRNELIIDDPKQYDHYLELLFYGDPPSIPGPVYAHLANEEVAQAERKRKVDQDFREVPGWLEGVIPEVKAPTLVVWGREDEILHWSGSTRFEVIDARVEILEGCGHACLYRRPEEIGGLIRAHQRAASPP